MIINVGIATCGRSSILAESLRVLAKQTRLPDKVILCPTKDEDIPYEAFDGIDLPIEVIHGPAGCCLQRNNAIANSQDAEVIVFLDDDFFVASDFLERCEALFESMPIVVAATGKVLADGVVGPGLSVEEALSHLPKDDEQIAAESSERSPERIYTTYGCNMVFRMSTIIENQVWFDERLPLYAWQEDVDFSRQLSKYGDIVLDPSLRGVHLGHKSGRTSGLRLGYSQIINPVYLMRKGTLSFSFVSRLMLRNFSKNLAKFLFPESHVDRRGRLKGNLIALTHVLKGKVEPEFILKL